VTSISSEIESSLLSLEKKMEETSQVVETQQKEILFQIIKEKHREQYIKNQRRIEALRSPFASALGALQSIFGEEQEKEEEKREIDTSVLDEDFEATRKYLEGMNYEEVLEFFHYFSRMGLKRANNRWVKRRKEENWEKYKL
jgi:hypothetical protein